MLRLLTIKLDKIMSAAIDQKRKMFIRTILSTVSTIYLQIKHMMKLLYKTYWKLLN